MYTYTRVPYTNVCVCAQATRVFTVVDVSCEACIRHYELKIFTPRLCGELPYPLASMCISELEDP